MHDQSFVPLPRQPLEEVLLVVGVVVALALFAGPLTCGLILYVYYSLRRQRKRQKAYLILSVLVVASLPLLWLLVPLIWDAYRLFFQDWVAQRRLRFASFEANVIPSWIWSLSFVPGGVLVFDLFDKLFPKSLDQLERERQARLAQLAQQQSQQAHKQAQKGTQPFALQLGPFIGGEYFQENTGVYVDGRQLVCFVPELFSLGWFVIGAPGAGKSTTLMRIMFEALYKTDIDVYFVDGKGELETAEAFRRMACHAHYGQRGNVPIFRLGHPKRLGCAIYNGFAGSADAISNRLLNMIGVREGSGDSKIYRNQERNIIKLICTAPEGPPRSFEEVVRRIDIDYLRQVHANNPINQPLLKQLEKRDLAGLLVNIMPVVQDLYQVVGPEGFSIGEARAAAFSIKTGSVEDTAISFFKFLIEDLKDYAGNSERQKRPALLVIDEFGQFGNENIIQLLATSRSANIGIVIATQTVASLGEQIIRENILENNGTVFLMRTPNPEPVAKLAGTVKRLESSMQHDQGQFTYKGSSREQDQYKIDLNVVRQLPAGEGFLIRMGQYAHLKTAIVNLQSMPVPPPEVVTVRQLPIVQSSAAPALAVQEMPIVPTSVSPPLAATVPRSTPSPAAPVLQPSPASAPVGPSVPAAPVAQPDPASAPAVPVVPPEFRI